MTSLWLFILKNYVNVASKSNKDPEPDPDPLVRGTDPRTQIRTKCHGSATLAVTKQMFLVANSRIKKDSNSKKLWAICEKLEVFFTFRHPSLHPLHQSIPVFRIFGFNWVSVYGSGLGIRMRIKAGQTWPPQKGKKEEFSCLKSLNALCKGLRRHFCKGF